MEVRQAYGGQGLHSRTRQRRPRQTGARDEQRREQFPDGDNGANEELRGSEMADQTQQQTGSDSQNVDLSQQITEAIQPVMEDLQQQITQTVQQQLQQVSGAVGANGSGTLSLDNLGSLGETLQSSLDSAVDSLQPFFQWLMEKLQQLVSWIMSLFIGGSAEGSQEAEQQAENQ